MHQETREFFCIATPVIVGVCLLVWGLAALNSAYTPYCRLEINMPTKGYSGHLVYYGYCSTIPDLSDAIMNTCIKSLLNEPVTPLTSANAGSYFVKDEPTHHFTTDDKKEL